MKSIGPSHTGAIARFGAWSKRAAIISLGGLPSRSGDCSYPSFLHHFLFLIISIKQSKIKR